MVLNVLNSTEVGKKKGRKVEMKTEIVKTEEGSRRQRRHGFAVRGQTSRQRPTTFGHPRKNTKKCM